jgi:diguanylate cyclase (GGDEF)-like protein
VFQLEHESITDPLTGIYNRRYLDRRLAEEVLRARRYAEPLSILLVDIDHFKRVNDVHGHPMGDVVLRGFGRLTCGVMRVCDIGARYGGDEFMVITPSVEAQAAGVLAERLRLAVSQGTDPNGERLWPPVVSITVSIGVASLSAEVEQPDQLLRLADAALYQAKETGRNRVVISQLTPA